MLGWAEHNLDTLTTSMLAFQKTNPYGLWSDVDEETGERRLRISITDIHHPDEWTFQIGDIVHNLRVALDYIAFKHAARLDPGITSDIKRLRNVMFPICERLNDWPATVGRLGWASEEMRIRLAALQPYHRPDLANLHPLLMLNRLDNPHKHQSLLQAAPTVTNIDFDLNDPRGVASISRMGLEGPFENGAVVARVRFNSPPVRIPHTRPSQVNMRVGFQVAFGEACALNGFPAMPLLLQIAKHIEEVVFPAVEPVI